MVWSVCYEGRGICFTLLWLPCQELANLVKKEKNFEQESRDRVSRLPPWTLLMPVWKLPFKTMYAFCWSCPSATFASQHGGFVPREWQATKGLFETTRCVIVCFVGWTHHWYGPSCPTLSLGYIDRCLERRTLHRADVAQVDASGTLRYDDGEGNENVNRALD